MIDERADRDAFGQLLEPADMVDVVVGREQVVDPAETCIRDRRHDAVGVPATGVAAVDEERLARGGDEQHRLTALRVDDINGQRLRVAVWLPRPCAPRACAPPIAGSTTRPATRENSRTAPRDFISDLREYCQPIYLSAEKSVGSRNTDSTLVVSGPSFSDSALAFTHSGSARNSAQFFAAASRLGCART